VVYVENRAFLSGVPTGNYAITYDGAIVATVDGPVQRARDGLVLQTRFGATVTNNFDTTWHGASVSDDEVPENYKSNPLGMSYKDSTGRSRDVSFYLGTDGPIVLSERVDSGLRFAAELLLPANSSEPRYLPFVKTSQTWDSTGVRL
jgi:hypothetical protein